MERGVADVQRPSADNRGRPPRGCWRAEPAPCSPGPRPGCAPSIATGFQLLMKVQRSLSVVHAGLARCSPAPTRCRLSARGNKTTRTRFHSRPDAPAAAAQTSPAGGRHCRHQNGGAERVPVAGAPFPFSFLPSFASAPERQECQRLVSDTAAPRVFALHAKSARADRAGSRVGVFCETHHHKLRQPCHGAVVFCE